MKGTWFCLIFLTLLISCQGIKTVNSDMEEEQLGCENEISTAILWVDRKDGESLQKYGFIRTAKVHANVYSDGTFRIMSFCKTQDSRRDFVLASQLLLFHVRVYGLDTLA